MALRGLFFIWIVLGVAVAGVTVGLIARVWKQRKEAPNTAKLITLIVMLAATFGGLGTLIGLVMGFTAVGGEVVEPSQKARKLAEGIALAMNCTALGVMIWLPSVIAGFVITRSRHRRP